MLTCAATWRQVEVCVGDELEVEGDDVDGWLQVMCLRSGQRGLVPAWAVRVG